MRSGKTRVVLSRILCDKINRVVLMECQCGVVSYDAHDRAVTRRGVRTRLSERQRSAVTRLW